MSRLPDAVMDDIGRLPVQHLPAASVWYRISQLAYRSPVYFGRTAGGRFTADSGAFGTLYLAATLTGVLAESICRNASLRAAPRCTSQHDLAASGLYAVTIAPPLRLLDFTVVNLARYGLDARIYSEYDDTAAMPYRWGPGWSEHAHDLGLDGILYRSRHHTASVCLALFERPPSDVDCTLIQPLDTHVDTLRILVEEFSWAIV